MGVGTMYPEWPQLSLLGITLPTGLFLYALPLCLKHFVSLLPISTFARDHDYLPANIVSLKYK